MARNGVSMFFSLCILLLTAVCPLATWAIRGDKDCDYAPEIVLVQDVTNSWQVAIENMARSMPAVFDMLSKKFPGTKFGIVSFKDDPACGYRSDFCAHLDQSLLSPGATNMAGTQKVVEGLYPGGGMDPSENFFGAIARAVLSPQVGWTPPDQVYDAQGRPILRLLIATTDCPSHMPKQKSKCWDKRNKHHDITIFSPKPNFAPFPTRGESSWLAEDINARCGADSFEYPDPIDVTQLMKERNIMPIYLFARGTAPTTRHQPNETFKYADYFNFASKFHYKAEKYPQFFDPNFDDGFMQLMKQWFSNHLHENPIIENMDDAMSNFPELLERTITESLRRKCLETTSTTTTPTTTPSRVTSETTTASYSASTTTASSASPLSPHSTQDLSSTSKMPSTGRSIKETTTTMAKTLASTTPEPPQKSSSARGISTSEAEPTSTRTTATSGPTTTLSIGPATPLTTSPKGRTGSSPSTRKTSTSRSTTDTPTMTRDSFSTTATGTWSVTTRQTTLTQVGSTTRPTSAPLPTPQPPAGPTNSTTLDSSSTSAHTTAKVSPQVSTGVPATTSEDCTGGTDYNCCCEEDCDCHDEGGDCHDDCCCSVEDCDSHR